MKPCRKNRKLIVWSLIDALDHPQATELAQHLQRCEGCRRYREEISQVTRGLSSIKSLAEVPAARDRQNRIPLFSRATTGSLQGLANWGRNAFSWHVGVASLCVIALGLLVLISVLQHRVPSLPLPHESPSVKLLRPSPDLPATIANYRAVANQSLDELDDLLAKQARRPVAAPPIFTPRTLALLQIPE